MKELDIDRATLLCTYVRCCTELAEYLVEDFEAKPLRLSACEQLYALLGAARIYNGALLELLLGGDGTLPHLSPAEF